MGQSPPAGLSRVVTLNPSPSCPLVSSRSIFLPIFLVLTVMRALAARPVPGTAAVLRLGETVATRDDDDDEGPFLLLLLL